MKEYNRHAVSYTLESPRIFKLLKEEIIRLSDEGFTLLRMSELKQQFEMRRHDDPFTYEELEAVVGLLAGPGHTSCRVTDSCPDRWCRPMASLTCNDVRREGRPAIRRCGQPDLEQPAVDLARRSEPELICERDGCSNSQANLNRLPKSGPARFLAHE